MRLARTNQQLRPAGSGNPGTGNAPVTLLLTATAAHDGPKEDASPSVTYRRLADDGPARPCSGTIRKSAPALLRRRGTLCAVRISAG